VTTTDKRRLHGLAAVHSTLSGLREMVWLLVLAMVTGDGGWQSAAFFLFLPVGVVFGVGRWWRMRYWLEGDELRVSQGFLFRREVFLPKGRIQAIDLSAGILHRLFGVVRLQIKSGAAGTQVDLTAVSRPEAERLMAALRPEDGDAEGREIEDGRVVRRASGAVSRTWTLVPGRLLLLGALSKRLGILLSFIAYVFGQFMEAAGERMEEWALAAGEVAPVFATSPGPILWILLGFLAILVSWGLSIVDTLLRWGRFDVQRTADRVTVRRGLIEQRRVSLAADRLQAVRLVEGPFFLRLGYTAVFVESVGHQEEKGASTCLHPMLKSSSLRPFLAEIAPEFLPALDARLIHPPRRAAIRFFLKPLLFWAVAATAFAWFVPRGFLGFTVLLPVAYLALRSFQETGFGTTGSLGILVSRGLQRTTVLFPRKRVQTASVTAGPFQRRRRLATASVVVASGAHGRTFAARDLDEGSASELFAWWAPPSQETQEAEPSPGSLGPERQPGST
jgi:putative membrane protein